MRINEKLLERLVLLPLIIFFLGLLLFLIGGMMGLSEV